MKLDDSILNQFNLDPKEEREPVSVLRISELLDFMKESALRIKNKSEQYFKTEDADIQVDCMDIVAIRLNDFVQAFIDLMIFIRKQDDSYNGHSDSLRYCMTSYDALVDEQQENEKHFLKELLLRNEITHDYFNRDIHQQKLIALMQNYADGAEEVYNHLRELCEKNGWMELFANNNRNK
ncbi:MAG: hypothetical protein E7302_08455 [Butyrivibrio sp.]|nr:hypothetical protein [Butyrivibrio sp.]